MSREWTKEQYASAMNAIESNDAFDGLLEYGEAETTDAVIALHCELNEALDLLEKSESTLLLHEDDLEWKARRAEFLARNSTEKGGSQ